MANNKKIFTIEINGLAESIKAVDALQEKINALQKTLKEFGKNGIEIPIEFGDSIKKFEKSLNTIKQKASKITLAPASDDAEYNKLLAERQKQLAAVNRELADTKKNVEEYKQETKDLVALEKKARNEAQGYANTMNGLKKQLKDLNAIKGEIPIDSKEFLEISDLIGRINKELRDLEAAQNIFSRGVGDYYNSFAEALKEVKDNAQAASEEVKKGGEETDAFASKYEKLKAKIKEAPSISFKDIMDEYSINDLEEALKRIDKERRGATGADRIKSAKELYDVIKRLSNEQKRLNDLQVQADNQLKTQHQSIINKTIYTWENVTTAAGEFEDKLYQLKTLGKENTKEYQNFFNEAVRLKKAIRQVDYEVDAMVESSKGINKMVSMTQGLTALFQGATGIGQLFGMNSENAMKGIQTMTALQGIAASLQTIQDLVNKGSAFGKMIENWGSRLLVFTGWIQAARTEWFKLMEGLNSDLPDNLNKPIASVWVDYTTKKIIYESGFDEMPYAIARINVPAGFVYGFSPAMNIRHTIQSLNKLVRQKLNAGDLALTPAMNVPLDTYVNPLSLKPAALNYHEPDSPYRAEPMHTVGNFQINTETINDARTQVRQGMLIDLIEQTNKEFHCLLSIKSD